MFSFVTKGFALPAEATKFAKELGREVAAIAARKMVETLQNAPDEIGSLPLRLAAAMTEATDEYATEHKLNRVQSWKFHTVLMESYQQEFDVAMRFKCLEMGLPLSAAGVAA